MPETEPKQVEELAAAIHKARTLTLPCPDNYDEDLDAWCWEAARIVLALGWVSPEEVAAREAAARREALLEAADDLEPLVDNQHSAALNPDAWLRDRAEEIPT